MDTTRKSGLDDIVSFMTSQHENIAREDAERLLKEWIAVITDTLPEKEQVEVPGFGLFSFSPIRENDTVEQMEKGVDPVTRYYRVGFTPAETLKNGVNSFFAHFEPSLLSEGVTFDALPEVITGESGDEVDDTNQIEIIVTTKPDLPTIAAEPVEEAPEITNVLSLSLQHASPKPNSYSGAVESIRQIQTPKSHRPTSPEQTPVTRSLQPERVRKRSKSTTIWIPILGGAAIILAGLFFFNAATEKSGRDNL